MTLNRFGLLLLALAAMAMLVGCKDESDNSNRPRSLADAAANLRSSSMVETAWRGHIRWNGSAKMFAGSECALQDDEYLLIGRGDGVTLRLAYRAARAGVLDSVDFAAPVRVDLQLERAGSAGALYRAEPPVPGESEIISERKSTFGSTRLEAFNESARRANPDGVVAEFEFLCW